MPRPRNILRPTRLETSIPEDIRAWLELHLYSSVEQKVPLGAIQRVIVALLREYREQVESGQRSPL